MYTYGRCGHGLRGMVCTVMGDEAMALKERSVQLWFVQSLPCMYGLYSHGRWRYGPCGMVRTVMAYVVDGLEGMACTGMAYVRIALEV